MSKKPKKGAAKPTTVEHSAAVSAAVSSNVDQPAPNEAQPRQKKAKLKAGERATKKAKTVAKETVKKSNESPKVEPAARPKGKVRTAKGASGEVEPITQPVVSVEPDASGAKRSKRGSKNAPKGAAKPVVKEEPASKGGSKPKAKDATKDADTPKVKTKSKPLKVDAKQRKHVEADGLSHGVGKKQPPAKSRTTTAPDDGPELTFANSPFAVSPHVDEIEENVEAADEAASPAASKAKKKARPDKQSTEPLKDAPSKRRKGAKNKATTLGAKDEPIEELAEDEGNERLTAPAATEHSDEGDADANETLIEPAALAPEGEPVGDEEDGEEPSLFSNDAPADDEREVLSEEEENRRYLKGILEALLFSSDKPLSGRELARAARIDKKRTMQLLLELRKEYRHRGVNIAEISGGFVLRSNPTYGAYVQKALALRPVRLSRAQLETLAIIAYRQPITRPEIDDIRGVDSGQVLKGLADRDLIKMLGKKDEAGRPMLYGTTEAFLELFSLESLKGLPSLREFTELSDDSKEKFAQVTGENMPSGETAAESDESANAQDGVGDVEDSDHPR